MLIWIDDCRIRRDLKETSSGFSVPIVVVVVVVVVVGGEMKRNWCLVALALVTWTSCHSATTDHGQVREPIHSQ